MLRLSALAVLACSSRLRLPHPRSRCRPACWNAAVANRSASSSARSAISIASTGRISDRRSNIAPGSRRAGVDVGVTAVSGLVWARVRADQRDRAWRSVRQLRRRRPPAPRSSSAPAPMCCMAAPTIPSRCSRSASKARSASMSLPACRAGAALRAVTSRALLEHDPPLDAGAHRAELAQIVHHLVRASAARQSGTSCLGIMREHAVAVTAARHEIVGRELVDFRLVERRVADMDREHALPGGRDRSASKRRPETCGKRPALRGNRLKPFSSAARTSLPDISSTAT